MRYGNDNRHIVDDLENNSVTKNMQQRAAKGRIVRQGFQLRKAEWIRGYCGEACSKIVQKTPAKPARLTVEILAGLLNLLFGLNQDAEIHGESHPPAFGTTRP